MRKSLFTITLLTITITTGCGTSRFLGMNFGTSPIGAVLCPAAKATANLEIAKLPICKSAAPFAIASCLAAQIAADQVVMAGCGTAVPPIPAGREATRAATAAVPEDPRIALQRIYESVGMSPMMAAKKAAQVVRP